MGKLIYLDNAATTKTAPEVVEAMLPYFTEHFGNPSSVYSVGSSNKEVITKQRETIAKALGAKTDEIYFTAGGSESDNWALKATAEAYESKGKHIITTKIEHHAILHTGEYLEKRGYEVTYLDVDEMVLSVRKLWKLQSARIRYWSVLCLLTMKSVRSNRLKKSGRSHINMESYSIQMQFRHLDRFQST